MFLAIKNTLSIVSFEPVNVRLIMSVLCTFANIDTFTVSLKVAYDDYV